SEPVSEADTTSSRKPSPLWNYFKFSSEEPNRPTCSKCGFKFSSKTRNSSLEKHLNTQHNIKIEKIKTQKSRLPFFNNNPEVFDQYSASDKLTHVSPNIVKDDIITTRNYFHGLKQCHES
ncbi:12119_t:CDS:2, partial [Racocetra fulgida]